MTVMEYFPLMKEEKVNPHLMSFSNLYLDEIVQTILDRFNNAPIKDFLTAIDESDLDIAPNKDDVEWLVMTLLKSEEGFKKLHTFLSTHNLSLVDQMMIRNESGVHSEVVKAFKEYFLRKSDDIDEMRLKKIAEEKDIGSDDEEEKTEEQKEKEEEEKKKLEAERKPDDVIEVDMMEGMEEVKEEEEEQTGYVYTVLDRVAAIFDPEFAHQTLIGAYSVLKSVTDPLETPSDAPEMNYIPWARAILRQLPRLPYTNDDEKFPNFPSMVYNFARSCESSPTNRAALAYLFPDYIEKLEERDAARRALLKGGKQMKRVEDIAKECRPAENYVKHRKGSIHEYQTTVMPITLRDYQKELVQKANKGDNTVVVAPTGSGKTVVAAQIMRHHAMKKRAEGKPYRMIMVVPKIPLVEQQHKQLKQYMSDVVYSSILHGDMMFETEGKKEKVLCAELIVMTAQILINLLESVRDEERIFVADMTLLILDECHHCDSNHPYAQLMSIIREWEYDKPQVIGLTASLGVGQDGANSESTAYNHVAKLLARMTATSISTIVVHMEELQSHVQLPIDDIRDVRPDLGDVDGDFTKNLHNFMNAINLEIRGDLQKMTHPANESGALIPLSLVKTHVPYKETEKYGGRVEALKQAIRGMKDGTKKVDILMALEILKVCNMTWGMNDLLPSSTAWAMMKAEMFALKNRNSENRFIKLFYDTYELPLNKYNEAEDSCRMLNALRQELRDQMRKDPKSKAIVFVATRELAKNLAEYISDHQEFLGFADGRECDFIISSKARGAGAISQSPAEQKAALQKFRDDKLAVLVSTTVAEEGLDVPECNLIIKYNMTGNVISLTQQRGRARAKDSRSVLIVLNKSVKQRELENAMAEKMMNHIVRKIHKEGEAKLMREVEKETNVMKAMEEQLKREAAETERRLMANSFHVLCGDCNTSLCESYHIKNGATHYFACNPDIWGNINVNYIEEKGKYIDTATTVVGKVLCKGSGGACGVELGKVVRYWGCYFPSLKCAFLQFRNKRDNSLNSRKKWSDLTSDLFYVSKINDDDVSDMMNSLSMNNPKMFEMMETKCKELLSKSRKEAFRKYDMRKDDGAQSD